MLIKPSNQIPPVDRNISTPRKKNDLGGGSQSFEDVLEIDIVEFSEHHKEREDTSNKDGEPKSKKDSEEKNGNLLNKLA